jgi:diguanylate cyclase (GGDEF)-like protein
MVDTILESRFIPEQIDAINRYRITRILLILLPIHLAHIAFFWPFVPGATLSSEVWRNGIILVHAAMVVMIALFLPISLMLQPNSVARRAVSQWLAGLVGLLYLLCGAALGIVDQLVTSSINPVLISAVGVAMLIFVRPAVSALNYTLVLLFFVVGVAWTQPNADLLLMIRVNSITALALGFGLSLIQWQNRVMALKQERQIARQQQELEEKNREFRFLASRDAMTGLMNRAQFLIEANKEVESHQRSGAPACLIMLDIDHFKQANDTYGHPAGDSVLVQIADILNRELRNGDLLSRFGGEEFALLLPVTSLPEAVQVAERVRAAIAEQPFAVRERSIRVTASFGVTQCAGTSHDALDECYRAADRALYRAKQDGRNCVRSA